MPLSSLSEVLQGITVLDLSRNLAGPYCTMLLGDLGADVIKVESPGSGDDTRSWRPPAWNAQSATFLACNRNKRSITIDLDVPAGQQLVRRLATGAHVMVSSFRPGSLSKRGLDFESLREANEGLVYCSITAYGSKGPKKDAPGYDAVLQAETGMMSMNGHPDQTPARLGIAAIDLGTGMWAAVGIQAALRNQAETGAGALVEVSLYETAAWLLSYHLQGYLATGESPQRQGNEAPFVAPYEVFATADGDLMVTAGNDRLFAVVVPSTWSTGPARGSSVREQRRQGRKPFGAPRTARGPVQNEDRRRVGGLARHRNDPLQSDRLCGRPRR